MKQRETLLNVRYYGESIHPAQFRSVGWMGFVVLALNWLRYQLETFVQYLVLRIRLADPQNQESYGTTKTHVLQRFWIEVEDERRMSQEDDPRRGAILTGPTSPAGIPWRQRHERYTQPRESRVTQEDGQTSSMAPASILGLAARLSSKGRNQRYGRSVSVMEDHFAPLDPETPEKTKGD